jgi:putative transposase
MIGTIRRECLDHLIVLNRRHLFRILREYLYDYYHPARTHLSLERDSPFPRAVEPPALGALVETPVLGGLHHIYSRRAA